MNILIFIDWFVPAYKAGGPIQSIANMVAEQIGQARYRIVCSNKDLDGIVLDVPTDKWVRFNSYTEVWYNSKKKNIIGLARSTEWPADVIFINGIFSLWYNLVPLIFSKAVRSIVSTRGMLHAGALTQKRLKKKIYLFLMRLSGFTQRIFFHASTIEEADFIRDTFGNEVMVFVAPNFPRHMEASLPPKKHQGVLQLVSVGIISPMKNYLEVLKALSICQHKISYSIYGPIKDASYWKSCEAVIANLPSNIDFAYRGEITPALVPAVLANNEVFILPSKSENYGHAIYEAFIAGRPVITSHGTPWNDLSVANAGRNINPHNHTEMASAIDFFAAMASSDFIEWCHGAKVYAAVKTDLSAIRRQYAQMFGLSEKHSIPVLNN